ncbi:translation initiation factor IF-3 [bacterium F11]|nr:translation initiation factor IF-3 [bacterium F11]
MRNKIFVRVNSNIRSPEVRLINDNGELIGVKPIQEAIRLAQDAALDLIEVAPNANPPVCRIGNFSKFLYEKTKKSKESRKHRGSGHVKEVRFRMKIGEHDFNVKVDRIVRFLKEHHKVRISFMFFGREMQHRDRGDEMLRKIEEAIKGAGVVEQRPQMYGNRMITILVPHKG